MAGATPDPIDTRRKFVEAWNKTMIDIWQEQIHLKGIEDTGKLYHSPILVRFAPDQRILSLDIAFSFLEYGVWQHFGTGREIAIGNPGDVKCLDDDYRKEHKLDEPRKRGPKWGGGMTSGFPREERPWLSEPYYRSVMNIKDFMAESIGDEFKGIFAGLGDSDYRRSTLYRQAHAPRTP